MFKRTLWGIAVVFIVVVLLWLGLSWVAQVLRQPGILGSYERVILHTPSGGFELTATVDTGADLTSIDRELALSLGLAPEPGVTRRIITEIGVVERQAVRLRFQLDGREITSEATLADRTAFTNRMLVGKADLSGFVVDSSRQFLTRPADAGTFYFVDPGALLGTSRLGRIIIMLPVLASIVVLLRLLAGIRTYGVFAPTIIAITLMDLGVLPGAAIYLFTVVAGMATKVLILNRLRLPRIAEFALVMSVLVALLSAVTALSGFISIQTAFFPLIVTTHLVEQTSRSVEEHTFSEALLLLGSTIAVALLLAGAGSLLLGQSLAVLWTAFAGSIVATLVAGNYLGLRLSEFIRFKFLRRTHVH
ncbi:MAG: hypothetical protein HYX91_02595 [Chloroflexi bacterium]|nr:hypothetical protein [Chloroflexota bacterium]